MSAIFVYVVQGEHPYVPGRPMTVHLHREDAEREALKLANLILKDLHIPHRATTWREADKRLKALDDTEADVWITRLKLRMS